MPTTVAQRQLTVDRLACSCVTDEIAWRFSSCVCAQLHSSGPSFAARICCGTHRCGAVSSASGCSAIADAAGAVAATPPLELLGVWSLEAEAVHIMCRVIACVDNEVWNLWSNAVGTVIRPPAHALQPEQ